MRSGTKPSIVLMKFLLPELILLLVVSTMRAIASLLRRMLRSKSFLPFSNSLVAMPGISPIAGILSKKKGAADACSMLVARTANSIETIANFIFLTV